MSNIERVSIIVHWTINFEILILYYYIYIWFINVGWNPFQNPHTHISSPPTKNKVLFKHLSPIFFQISQKQINIGGSRWVNAFRVGISTTIPHSWSSASPPNLIHPFPSLQIFPPRNSFINSSLITHIYIL